jgi:nitrogen fixation NifU-like protein
MSGLDSLYQELILDHSKRPVGKGELEAPEGALTASHHEFNPSCGDELTLSIAVDPGTGRIERLAWEGQGCSISMASASVLAQLVRDGVEGVDEGGLTMEQAQRRVDAFREMIQSRGEVEPDEDLLGDAIAFQGVSKFVMRVKCAMLGWVALEADMRQIEAAR